MFNASSSPNYHEASFSSDLFSLAVAFQQTLHYVTVFRFYGYYSKSSQPGKCIWLQLLQNLLSLVTTLSFVYYIEIGAARMSHTSAVTGDLVWSDQQSNSTSTKCAVIVNQKQYCYNNAVL